MTTEQRFLDKIDDAEEAYRRYRMLVSISIGVFVLGIFMVIGGTVIGLVFPWSSQAMIPAGTGLCGLIFSIAGGVSLGGLMLKEAEKVNNERTQAQRAFRDHMIKKGTD